MYKLINNKGVTIVSLTVIIIILLILASIGVNIGIKNIKSVQDSKLTAELQMVQHAILEQYSKYKTTKDVVYLVGNKITNEEVNKVANELGINLVQIPETYSNTEYYKLDKASLVAIGIQDSTDEYIINYITGEVMNITKKLSDNTPLYITATSNLI